MPGVEPCLQTGTGGLASWIPSSNHFCSGASEVVVVRGACLHLMVISVISFLVNILCATAAHCSPEGFVVRDFMVKAL